MTYAFLRAWQCARTKSLCRGESLAPRCRRRGRRRRLRRSGPCCRCSWCGGKKAQRTQDGVGLSAWRPWLTRGRDGLVAVRRGVEVNAKVTVGLRRIMTPAPPLVGCRWAHKPIVRASTPYFVCACGVQTYNPARLQDCCRLFASQTLPSASELRSGLTLFAGCAHALQEYLHSKL